MRTPHLAFDSRRLGDAVSAVALVMCVSCVSRPSAPIAPGPGAGGAAAVPPTVSSEAVRQTLRSHLTEVHKCYKDVLVKQPDLSGKLVLQWDIVEKGRVHNVRVVRPLHPELDDCIAGALENWTFPLDASKRDGTTTRVVFPFVFSSQDAEN